MPKTLDLIFTQRDSAQGMEFVEIEIDGKSINVGGHWGVRPTGDMKAITYSVLSLTKDDLFKLAALLENEDASKEVE